MTTPVPQPFLPHQHSRGYLPHRERPNASQFVTFRLGDSLPAELVWRHRPREGDTTADKMRHLLAIEAELDACRGECLLRDPRVAGAVEGVLRYFEGQRYDLLAWVVMPNHVHVVIRLRYPWTLARVVHTWKWRSGLEANRILGRRGRLWQPEYFDRLARDEEHEARCVRYVEINPVKARLCTTPWDWPFGSARLRKREWE